MATGETDEEVIANLQQHGATAHKEMMDAMTDEQKMAMGQRIKELLAKQM